MAKPRRTNNSPNKSEGPRVGEAEGGEAGVEREERGRQQGDETVDSPLPEDGVSKSRSAMRPERAGRRQRWRKRMRRQMNRKGTGM